MTNVDTVSDGAPIAAPEPPVPASVIVFAVAALSAEALWLGFIGWWLLNLF
jgi:hypothetical protein